MEVKRQKLDEQNTRQSLSSMEDEMAEFEAELAAEDAMAAQSTVQAEPVINQEAENDGLESDDDDDERAEQERRDAEEQAKQKLLAEKLAKVKALREQQQQSEKRSIPAAKPASDSESGSEYDENDVWK